MVAWGGNAAGQLGTGDTTDTDAPGASAGTAWESIDTGTDHTCGIRSDGTAWCWGGNGSGRLGIGVDYFWMNTSPVPVQVGASADWVQISAGTAHTCGLRSNGTAWCWGYNGTGVLGTGNRLGSLVPLQVSGGATNWSTIHAAREHTCATRTDGTVWCWGANGRSQLGNGTTAIRSVVPVEVSGGATNWSKLSTGGYRSCATRSDGTAWCWGDNHSGQFGDGTNNNSNVPVQVAGSNTDWSTIDTGASSTCATKTDGTGWCWGDNSFGQNGDGTNNNSNVPVQVAGSNTDWSTIEAGDSHTCGIRTDGRAWCWGLNYWGYLGDGTRTDSNIPVQVIGGHTDWTSIETGAASCAIKSTGTAWCWGWNGSGQLGDGTVLNYSDVPLQLESNVVWVQVAAGASASCKRSQLGVVWCWGNNEFGQLGTGDTISRPNPTPLLIGNSAAPGLGYWDDITAGSRHTCGRKADGTVWCWGYNVEGRLGDGTTTNATTPVQVDGGHTDWTAIEAGSAHSCGLRSDGTAWCWGDNSSGQLGNGTTNDSSVPVLVSGNHSFTSITTGDAHSCAVRTDNAMFCWGSNNVGQLGDGTTNDTNTPVAPLGGGAWKQVAAGGTFTCAIGSSNAVSCWGDNSSGQLGNGTTTNALTPTVITGSLSGFNAVDVGTSHACAIQTTVDPNVLYCWGNNSDGQLGNGTTTNALAPTQTGAGTQWVIVATGDRHTLAIDI